MGGLVLEEFGVVVEDVVEGEAGPVVSGDGAAVGVVEVGLAMREEIPVPSDDDCGGVRGRQGLLEATKQTTPEGNGEGREDVDVGDDEGAGGEKNAKMRNSTRRNDGEVGVRGRGEKFEGDAEQQSTRSEGSRE